MELNTFIKNWNNISKKYMIKHKDNQRAINNFQKTNSVIQRIINIYDYQQENHLSKNKAIKQLNLFKDKSTLYSFFNKIDDIKDKCDIESIIVHNTGPIHIKYIYDEETRKAMCDAYYIHHINKTNIWINFKKKKYPLLSLKTVCKIINSDPRNPKLKKRAKIKHRTRYYNLPFGNLQMDLKIIGWRESPTGKRITIFDAKDEQSKIYYMEVIKNASLPNLLQATENMIRYFEKVIGMKVKKIITDNAMAFRKNNFIVSAQYNDLLKSNNIVNEKIPLGQPECNGVIERQHKTLEEEFKPIITKDDTFLSLRSKAQKYMQWFNFDRFHYYTFLEKCSEHKTFESRIFIPIEFFKEHNKILN